MTERSRPGRPSRLLAALSAGVIALVAAIAVGVLVAKAFGEGAVPVLATLVVFGVLSAWLYTRAVDGRIDWRSQHRGTGVSNPNDTGES